MSAKGVYFGYETMPYAIFTFLICSHCVVAAGKMFCDQNHYLLKDSEKDYIHFTLKFEHDR
jgi:hypothetical protein